MKIINVDQNSQEWLEARKGKITGSKLKDLISKRKLTDRKIGFYQLIADKLALESDLEDPMERGHRLEEESLALFQKISGLVVEKTGLWISEDNENIACSPDGAIKVDGEFKIAVETKSLSSARHLEAFLTKQVPDDFEFQVLQYFIVNEKLETLYFCFFDPRVTVMPFFYIQIDRSDVEDEVKQWRDYQKMILKEVDQIVEELTF